jgi:H+-transporting ATPase
MAANNETTPVTTEPTTAVVGSTPALTVESTPVVNEKEASTTDETIIDEKKKTGRFDADFEEKEGPKHALVDMSTIELKAEDLYVQLSLNLYFFPG